MPFSVVRGFGQRSAIGHTNRLTPMLWSGWSVAGGARKLGVHRRLVREALGNAVPGGVPTNYAGEAKDGALHGVRRRRLEADRGAAQTAAYRPPDLSAAREGAARLPRRRIHAAARTCWSAGGRSGCGLAGAREMCVRSGTRRARRRTSTGTRRTPTSTASSICSLWCYGSRTARCGRELVPHTGLPLNHPMRLNRVH